MKVAGIITEYNPFHNGHKYHIEETKRVTGADYVIAVMSGNFVQRGTPALTDKYARAKMALNNGVDIVLELPVCYATGSAEYFAMGAVSLLDRLGLVDCLCFGSESGDIALLEEAARFLLNAPETYNEKLLTYLREGLTYPAARSKALEHYLKITEPSDELTNISQILSEPNNILGIEYLKAIGRLSSSITPITIQRQTAHYHATELTPPKTSASTLNPISPMTLTENETHSDRSVISSATAIRRTLLNSDSIFNLAEMQNSVPVDVYEYLSEYYCRTYPITEEDFSRIIKYKLLTETRQSLIDYVDLTPDLADRIMNIRDIDIELSSLVKTIKTKNMTHTRINRAFIHLLLNIKNENLSKYCKIEYTYYARVLGIRKESSHLLRTITDHGKLPVITKLTKGLEQLEEPGKQMLMEDIFAAHVYNQAVYEKFNTSILNEYKHGICIQ